MTEISRSRGIAIALLSVACAAVLFRAAIASALVVRGDDLARAGDVAGAVRAYARARRLDSASTIAADRLAFFLLLRRGRGDAQRALAIADSGLRNAPEDADLRADHALAAMRLGRWGEAERDFERAGRTARDPRYLRFAAAMAQRRHDRAALREHARAALELQPADAAAQATRHAGPR